MLHAHCVRAAARFCSRWLAGCRVGLLAIRGSEFGFGMHSYGMPQHAAACSMPQHSGSYDEI
eukprot:3795379-Alexandrium_andersonii.AAC.1